MSKFNIPIIAVSLLASFALHAADAPAHGVRSVIPAKKWEDAFVTGNGRMGALLFCDPVNDTLVANHCRLFLPQGSREIVPDLAQYTEQLRQIYQDKGPSDAESFILKKAREQGFPGIIFTDPFHPGLFVNVQQPAVGVVRDYQRTENFENGEVTVRWSDDRGSFERRLFVSRTDNLIVFNQTGPAPCELSFPPIGQPLIESQQETTPDWVTYHNIYKKGKGGYDAAVRIVRKNEGRDVTLLIRIAPWKTPLPKNQSEAWACAPENPDFKTPGRFTPAPPLADSSVVAYLAADDARALLPQLKASLVSVSPDYPALFAPHAQAHAALFNRVSFDLDGGTERSTPIEELLQRAQKEKRLPPALMEKMYDAGRYMLICCAGELAPNLQGIWTGGWSPRWSGDFTLDANVNCAMASACSANLPELMEGYFRLMESFYPEWRLNARRMYGCGGFLTNARASNTSLMLHWGSWPGNFWMSGCGWLASFFQEYADYTGDRQFLAQRVVPLLEETAAFYQDFLSETNSDGSVKFIPSYNPETGCGIDATMDIAVAREVLVNLIADCRKLNIESDNLPKWETLLGKLPQYPPKSVNFMTELGEWPDGGVSPFHRHCSQLYPCFQSFDPIFETDGKLRQAAKGTVRAKIVGTDNGEKTSFSRVQCGLAAAWLGMPEEAHDRIKACATLRSMEPSMITSHDPYGQIFNTDGNGGIPQIVATMLIKKNHLGELELLQALPTEWPQGSIKGLRAPGGFEVSLEWAGGKLQHAQIKSLIGSPLKLKYGKQTADFDTKSGQIITLNDQLAPQ